MNKVTKGILAGVLSIGSFAAVAPVVAQQQPQPQQQQVSESVFNVLSADPRFGTTMKMLYVAGAEGRVENANQLTVFAATDDAWDNSPYTGMLSSLSSTGAGSEFPQSMGILQVLRGFFVRGEPTQAPVQDVKMQSNAGRPIDFDKASGTVKWVDPDGDEHSAKVAGQPIQASNGVIYPIDAIVGS